ncbi:hypothetical protein GCM10027575_74810 [Phytohabitans suffuscus]
MHADLDTLITVAVLQALLGQHDETRWPRAARKHIGHLFPYLPKQPGYNDTCRPRHSDIGSRPQQARISSHAPKPTRHPKTALLPSNDHQQARAGRRPTRPSPGPRKISRDPVVVGGHQETLSYRDVRRGPDRCSRGPTLRVTQPNPPRRRWSATEGTAGVDQGLRGCRPACPAIESLINNRSGPRGRG